MPSRGGGADGAVCGASLPSPRAPMPTGWSTRAVGAGAACRGAWAGACEDAWPWSMPGPPPSSLSLSLSLASPRAVDTRVRPVAGRRLLFLNMPCKSASQSGASVRGAGGRVGFKYENQGASISSPTTSSKFDQMIGFCSHRFCPAFCLRGTPDTHRHCTCTGTCTGTVEYCHGFFGATVIGQQRVHARILGLWWSGECCF